MAASYGLRIGRINEMKNAETRFACFLYLKSGFYRNRLINVSAAGTEMEGVINKKKSSQCKVTREGWHC